ncbi:50S ribosomal protein L6 [Candidatus Aerophobetes bacterium]|nr:50S ribosomal protein L6 [Candidatus Aerophobetes bacterium]
MSRIGKKPIPIPEGVEVSIQDGKIKIKGSKGELQQSIPFCLKVTVEDNQILVKRIREDKQARVLHGTIRSLIFNMVKGVSEGYEKELKIVGMGYRAKLEGRKLSLNLGFSHPVEYIAPEGVNIQVPDPTTIKISGCDKQKVGEVAAQIRSFKKPDPYKGKGIRYKDEVVKLKVGKAALGGKG